jgi:hypothetical protein
LLCLMIDLRLLVWVPVVVIFYARRVWYGGMKGAGCGIVDGEERVCIVIIRVKVGIDRVLCMYLEV